LYRETARAVATPELAQKMTAIGFEPAAVPPEEVAARIKADMPKWAALIRAAKIKPYD
jgi:tripartite-type tricarboxylate transporter receptor subunit TctC